MRIVKLGLLSIIFLFVPVMLISLLIPSHVRLSRATNLPNERQRIWRLLRSDSIFSLANLDTAWQKGFDSLDKKVLEQTDSTYVLQLQQAGRRPVINGWQLYGTPASDSLTLQWYMDFHLRWYPWEKFSSLFYEHTYGTLLQKGLHGIKQQLTD